MSLLMPSMDVCAHCIVWRHVDETERPWKCRRREVPSRPEGRTRRHARAARACARPAAGIALACGDPRPAAGTPWAPCAANFAAVLYRKKVSAVKKVEVAVALDEAAPPAAMAAKGSCM